MRKTSLCCEILVACLTLLGCGSGNNAKMPKLGTVEGIVTLDGKPLEKARVEFTPASSRPSFGITDSSGKYVLQYDDQNKGAAVGDHKVRVSTKLNPANDKEDKVPAKFNDATTLTQTVKEGNNKINLELTSK